MNSWKDYITKVSGQQFASAGDSEKTAQSFSDDGSTFTLSRGKTPTHAVRAWNNANPDRRINLRELLDANPGVDERRYLAGVSYRMPSSARAVAAPSRPAVSSRPSAVRPVAVNPSESTERGEYPETRNNPGNMRHYGQGWFGEQTHGLDRGDFLRFDSPTNGLRAAARLIRQTLRRSDNPTISSLVPIYSPSNENDVATHTSNISRISGIGSDNRIDVENTGQMVDLLHGVVGAENGQPTWEWFTPQEHTNAVVNSRRSM